MPIFIVGVTWFMRWKANVDEKLSKALTEDRHNEICSQRTADLQKSVDRLRADMDSRHTENRETHRETRETLNEIRETVTGTHRRLDEMLLRAIDRSGGR